METFIDATLIIEGAVDEQALFETDQQFDQWLDLLREEHTRVKASEPWNVYSLRHDHAPYQECECAQYVLDHHPTHVIGEVQPND